MSTENNNRDVLEALQRFNRISEAAVILGMDRHKLRRRLDAMFADDCDATIASARVIVDGFRSHAPVVLTRAIDVISRGGGEQDYLRLLTCATKSTNTAVRDAATAAAEAIAVRNVTNANREESGDAF